MVAVGNHPEAGIHLEGDIQLAGDTAVGIVGTLLDILDMPEEVDLHSWHSLDNLQQVAAEEQSLCTDCRQPAEDKQDTALHHNLSDTVEHQDLQSIAINHTVEH